VATSAKGGAKKDTRGKTSRTSTPERKEESGNPSCFGKFNKCPECDGCSLKPQCCREKGKIARKANSGKRAVRPSRARSVKAWCWECNGNSSKTGCPIFSCPFYCFLSERRQLCGPPLIWWDGPRSTWAERNKAALLERREIKKDVEDKEEDTEEL
jgi:hypothetical protein